MCENYSSKSRLIWKNERENVRIFHLLSRHDDFSCVYVEMKENRFLLDVLNFSADGATIDVEILQLINRLMLIKLTLILIPYNPTFIF